MTIYLLKGYLDQAATSLADAKLLFAALANPATAANKATISRVAGTIETLVQGDSGEALTISSIDDANGTISSWVTDAQTTLAVGLGTGDPSALNTYASTTSFTIGASDRTGTLALNTSDLSEALRVYPRGLQFLLQCRKTDSAGRAETVGLVPVMVTPGVLESPVEDRDVDYTTFAEVEAEADAAAASAAAAASSATAAASSASAASTSATAAASSATSAATQATAAATSATSASTSATQAATSATEATNQAGQAATSASAAATSATSAASSATTASTQATNAGTSATNAATSATAAASSASAAATSATAAATSATAAATSASQAASITGCGSGNFGGTVPIIGANSVTAASATNLTLTGGSTGASLVLGNSTNAGAVLTTQGTGGLTVTQSGNASQNNITFASGGTAPVAFDFKRTNAAADLNNALQFNVYNGANRIAILQSFPSGTLDGGHWAWWTKQSGNSIAERLRLTDIGNLLIGGTTDISGSGGLKVFGTTAATNTTSGALQVAGGAGIAGALFTGGNITTSGALNFTSDTTLSRSSVGTVALTTTTAGAWSIFRIAPISASVAAVNQYAPFGTETPSNPVWFVGQRHSDHGALSMWAYDGTNHLTAALRISSAGAAAFSSTTEATTGGAGSLTTAGGIYAAKKIIGATEILSAGATNGIGYATGAGGTVTQATSRTTGVTLNKVTGAITLVSAAGSASWQSFTVTNSAVAATDTVRVCQKSGTDRYQIHVTNVGAGSFEVTFATTGGTTTEQPVFSFSVLKGATS